MTASERPFRVLVVVEGNLRPAACIVTILALISASSTMHIVGLMAGIAIGWRRVVVEMALVAGSTIHTDVLPVEWELRITIVVEELRLPFLDVVTIAALRTEAPLVDVRTDMAGGAVARCLLETLIRVAQTAGRVLVSSLEREFRLVVVEDRLLPGRVLVAGATVLAQAAAVHIILLVA